MSFSKTPPEFDYYTISRVLGEGGMGLVYLAHDRRTGLPVAIKVMSKRVFDPGLQARFLKENRILSALNHRNIVRCYEITQSKGGVPSIVMEYVDGVDIRAFEGRPYPELLPLMIQALMGLTYLRSQSILHRDLSSNNVFVTLENRKRVTKILDFGVAKLLQVQDPDADVKTQTGQFLGKFAFSSPELFLSSEVDWRSDVFSLGVIFHRLLTKKPPIEVARSTNYFDWIMAHQREHHFEVEAPPDVPPPPLELREVVRRMLARRPQDRPQSYEEIIDHLHRVQLDLPADLEPDPLSLETLPPPVAGRISSSGSGRTARTPSSPSVSRQELDAVPPSPAEAPSVEESQQKRWPDLEETIERAPPRPPSASESPVPPEPSKRTEMAIAGKPEKPPEVPVRPGSGAVVLPPEPTSSAPGLIEDKTERFDDVLAKLRQQSVSGPPLAPAPSPAARRAETETGPGRPAERTPPAPSATAGGRVVIYGESAPAPVPAPPRMARPVAAPPAPAPIRDSDRRRPRWIGIGLIVAAIVILFVAVLWGLISLLRGTGTSGTQRSSLAVPSGVVAPAALPCLEVKAI